MNIRDLTSNQYYDGLLNIKNKRVKFLKRFGFQYDQTRNVWFRSRWVFLGNQEIHNMEVHMAPRRVWRDTIARTLERGFRSTFLDASMDWPG